MKVGCTHDSLIGTDLSNDFTVGTESSLSEPRILNSVEDVSYSSQFETQMSGTHMDYFIPFISEGYISVIGDSSEPTAIKILRDTGASQSLVLANILPFSEKTSSHSLFLLKA